MEMHELLKATRDVIAERGHAKGALEEWPGGRVCLYGGMFIAHHGSTVPTFDEPTCGFAKALGFLTPGVAVSWNNAPNTTKDDVLERLDAAIEALTPERELVCA